MNQMSARRLAGLILSCAAVLAASPASAHAATVTITGDAGAAVPLTSGLSLRHMAPDVNFAFTGDEKFYAARVVGPAGPASSGTECTSFISPERVKYQGNGGYTLVYKTGADRNACNGAPEQSVPFTINASTAITPPGGKLLTRDPGKPSATQYNVPVALNPGADSYEFKYAPNATLGPDGGIAGETQAGFVDLKTGTAAVSFTKPGRYTFVVRAKTFRSDVPSAWSQRVDVDVLAPFDLLSVSYPDQRGPTYSLSAQIRETTATGKVTVSIGKGANPKRFRRLGVAKIRSGGKFKLKFRLRKTGKYVLRYSYAGGPTVAGGFEKQGIRISRRIF
jgi:hypothetical protein